MFFLTFVYLIAIAFMLWLITRLYQEKLWTGVILEIGIALLITIVYIVGLTY